MIKFTFLLGFAIFSQSLLAVDLIKFPEYFQFGLANAPAHAEDELHDSWLDFANDGHVKAYKNQVRPEDRLQFWSNPEIEIDLAASSGIKVFRMGVDWGRVVPSKPDCDTYSCFKSVLDEAALERYSYIIDYVISKGMKPMVTLFHHSYPRWGISSGSWAHESASSQFNHFAASVFKRLSDRVDHWVIFNEPSVYASLTHISGTWPSELVGYSMFDQRYYNRAQENMVESQKFLYDFFHEIKPDVKVGIAKYITKVTQKTDNRFNKLFLNFLSGKMNYGFIDMSIDHLDFIGVNYYGKEVIEGFESVIDSSSEYSEAGRAVDPDGLYEVLTYLNEKYNKDQDRKIPFWITENGISDTTDILRPSYFIEHLMAVRAAMQSGVDVRGYIFWTVSDNWEWADGYCPKFGLFEVDREHGLERLPRDSFFLFRDVVSSKTVTELQREEAWQKFRQNAGKDRYMCRGSKMDEGLDVARKRKIRRIDWRFSR